MVRGDSTLRPRITTTPESTTPAMVSARTRTKSPWESVVVVLATAADCVIDTPFSPRPDDHD